MPRADEAILRQASGLWADGPAIRLGQQIRGAFSAGIRRAKDYKADAGAPAMGRLAAIAVLGALVVALAAYNLHQRGASVWIDPPVLPRPVAPGPARHAVHASHEEPPPRPDAARPYPRSYIVLLSRSIFAMNGVASRRSSGGLTAANLAPPVSLSLKGITQEDTRFTAFVEDTAANKIFEVHLGDAIGPGRVCGITLHDLTYEVSGNRQRLEIDNISGRSGPPALSPDQTAPRPSSDAGSGQSAQPVKKKRKNQS